MVKTVVGEHHWTPQVIDDLFIDDVDYKGLFYWYDYSKEMNDNLKKKK